MKTENLINKKILTDDMIIKTMKDDFKDLLKFSEQALKKVWGNKPDSIWSEYLKK